MAAKTGFNIVRFQAPGDSAALHLESAFKLTAGLRPDINRAVCSYLEFQKLGDLTVSGTLGFYGSDENVADVAIAGIRIIDVEPLEFAETIDSRGVAIATKYRLFLADRRQQFCLPFGGRLRQGIINPVAKPADDPEQDDPPEDWIMSDLVQACLDAMGVDAALPDGIDDVEAPRDIKWFHSHAPTELAKLLDHAGYIFVMNLDGSFKVCRMGEGEDPTFPAADKLPETILKGIDRRGKTVVFTSAPLQGVETYEARPGSGNDATGGKAGLFRLVFPDASNHYWPIDKCPVFKQDPAGAWHNGFSKVDADVRGQAEADAFRLIGADPKIMDPLHAPLLKTTFGDPGEDGSPPPEIPMTLSARIATFDTQKQIWSNSPGSVPLKILSSETGEASIIRVAERLVRLKDGLAQTADLQSNSAPIGASGLAYRVSLSATKKDDKGNIVPRYFVCGFSRAGNAAALEMLDEDAAEAAMNDPATVVVPGVNLLAHWLNGEPVNLEDLQKKARTMASRYLSDEADPPKLMQCRGFFAFDLNGRVTECEIDQAAVLTRFHAASIFRPSGSYLGKDFIKTEAAGDAHPHQARSEPARAALRQPGSGQGPALHGQGGAMPALPVLQFVTLSKTGGSDGTATSFATWTYDLSDSSGTVFAKAVPVWNRPFQCSVTPATKGVCFRDPSIADTSNGTSAGGTDATGGPNPWRLVITDESPYEVVCT